MLSLNTYGLQKAPNQFQLPRIISPAASPVKETQSLSKLAQLRKEIHPLYRTTTGATYGRYVDFQDIGLVCSPIKKNCKKMTFTKSFLQGPFEDTSLESIEIRKHRIEVSTKVYEEKKIKTKLKYEEQQLELCKKRDIRRDLREKRRKVMEDQTRSAITIQRHARGYNVRNHLLQIRKIKEDGAARHIQTFARSKMCMYHAKQELDQLKLEKKIIACKKIQRIVVRYLAIKHAKMELLKRRESRIRRKNELYLLRKQQQNMAATKVQSLMRGYLVRNKNHLKTLAIEKQNSMSSNYRDKDNVSKRILNKNSIRKLPQKLVQKKKLAIKVKLNDEGDDHRTPSESSRSLSDDEKKK